MTEGPYDAAFQPAGLPQAPSDWPTEPLRTSGFAIASLLLGAIGLISCCFVLPSLLGLVFGFVALSIINRGEAAGRGLAIGGLVLSVIGLLLGAGVWTALILSPPGTPVTGAQVSQRDRKTLEAMKVLQAGEPIDLLCATGMFSVRQGGVVLTNKRLIVYSASGLDRAFNLEQIETIDYAPAANWLGEGNFIVTRDDGEPMSFTIDGMDQGDRLFHRALERRVAQMRKAAGKPPTTTTTTPESG